MRNSTARLVIVAAVISSVLAILAIRHNWPIPEPAVVDRSPIMQKVDKALARWYEKSLQTERYKAVFVEDFLQFDFRDQLFSESDEFDCTGTVRSRKMGKQTDQRAENIATQILAIKGVKEVEFSPYYLEIEKSGAYAWQEFAEVIFSVVEKEITSDPLVIAKAPKPDGKETPKPDVKMNVVGEYLVFDLRTKFVEGGYLFEHNSWPLGTYLRETSLEMQEIAKSLLAIDGVKSVRFSAYEIVVTKSNAFEWPEMQEKIRVIIVAKFGSKPKDSDTQA